MVEVFIFNLWLIYKGERKRNDLSVFVKFVMGHDLKEWPTVYNKNIKHYCNNCNSGFLNPQKMS